MVFNISSLGRSRFRECPFGGYAVSFQAEARHRADGRDEMSPLVLCGRRVERLVAMIKAEPAGQQCEPSPAGPNSELEKAAVRIVDSNGGK
jgi:hypothetical protein